MRRDLLLCLGLLLVPPHAFAAKTHHHRHAHPKPAPVEVAPAPVVVAPIYYAPAPGTPAAIAPTAFEAGVPARFIDMNDAPGTYTPAPLIRSAPALPPQRATSTWTVKPDPKPMYNAPAPRILNAPEQ